MSTKDHFSLKRFKKGSSYNSDDYEEKPTWAAKPRPAVLRTGHPGATVKLSVSLSRSVKRKQEN